MQDQGFVKQIEIIWTKLNFDQLSIIYFHSAIL